MKTNKLFIALIGILFVFNSAVTGGSLIDEDPKKEKITETVYINDLLGFELANRAYNALKSRIPEEYQNVEVIFEFGEKFKEEELKTEDWMSENLSGEPSLKVEDWMLEEISVEDPVKVEPWMKEDLLPDNDGPFTLSGVAKTGEKYEIYLSEEKYKFNGNSYDVYVVKYEEHSIKIGVNGKSYLVLGEDLIIFYKYTGENFGLYKVLFNNPEVKETLDHNEYRRQTELMKKELSVIETITIIVENFPLLLK